MKLSITPLTLLAAGLCAGTASAQIAPIRFSAPVSPIAGLPKLLPSPMTGPLVGTGISLPNLVPALTPSLSLAAAAAPALVPVSMPAHEGLVPAVPASPARDGVVNPLQRVMPGVVIRFGAAQTQPQTGAAKGDAAKEKLDETFDGEGSPKPVVGGRQPVTSGRHISLPEWDLERELGI